MPQENDGSPIEYFVKEVAVSGYTSKIAGNQNDGFIITNTPVPEESKPTEPTEPTEPSKPTEPTESEPNTPPPPSVTVSSPIVFKKVTGGQPETPDLFTFRIEPVSYKPDPAYPRPEPNSLPLPQGQQGAVQEDQISGEGTASTGQITYTQPGFYEYKIQELAAGDGKYIYSKDVYTFIDHVYMQDGHLAVDRTMYKNGQKANTSTAYFTNQYQGEPVPKGKITSLPATGEKDYLGWSLSLTLVGLGCLALIQKKRLG